VICADYDESGVGQVKAKEAALAVGGLVVVPPDAGDDFNDLHQKHGVEAVRAIVDAVFVTDNELRNLSVTDRINCEVPETLACNLVTDSGNLSNSNYLSHTPNRAINETIHRLRQGDICCSRAMVCNDLVY
jgi:phage/plasmid primase-like uncharacterized protein